MTKHQVVGISFDHMHMGDLLRQVDEHPDAEIAAIFDPDSARMEGAIERFGIPTIPGMDRDEYPPAVFAEGGAGASVRHIPLSDNRSAGGQMSAQLAGVPEGRKITMTVGP